MQGAGGGRPSKGAAARNRNKPVHETVVLPAQGREDVPSMPDWLPPDAEGPWTALWSTVEATQWSDADIPAVARMVLMQNDGSVIEDAKVLTELRQLEDRFGLNPYSRRQMKWVRGEPDVEPGAAAAAAPTRRLRAVDGEAAKVS